MILLEKLLFLAVTVLETYLLVCLLWFRWCAYRQDSTEVIVARIRSHRWLFVSLFPFFLLSLALMRMSCRTH